MAFVDLNQQDLERNYTPDEERRLTENPRLLTEHVHAGNSSSQPMRLNLLCSFHEKLFNAVCGHAGRYRSQDFGQEYLVFGPSRSVCRRDVKKELDRSFERLAKHLAALESNNAEDYDHEAIRVSVWAHAEIIRVHPFEDGNGRTSRLVLNLLLVRLGLRPIQIEACKQEYNDALNDYFRTGELQTLTDPFLRFYVV